MRSVSCSGAATRLLVVSIVATLAAPSIASPPEPAGTAPRGSSIASPPERKAVSPRNITGDSTTAGSVVIVLTGEAADDPALDDVLFELLDRQGIRARFVREARFDRTELLGSGQTDEALWAFVSVEGPSLVRLYFRGPRARRFLLRKLALRDGLDELGRELIGQAVASSVAALLHTGAGISPEEARASIDREEPSVAPTPVGPKGRSEATRDDDLGTGASSGPPPSRIGTVGAWLALRYELAWSGGDLGAAQGPGAEIGVDWGDSLRFRTRLLGVHGLAQTIASPAIGASVQSDLLRLFFDVGWPLGGASLLVFGAGGGLDVTRVAPHASDPAVSPDPDRVHSVPVLRGELRYELGLSDFRLVFAAFADGSLLRTHYDLDRAGTPEPIATPWRVRPGAAFIVSWNPSLGGPRGASQKAGASVRGGR